MRKLTRAAVVWLLPILAWTGCDRSSRPVAGDFRLRQLTTAAAGGGTRITYELWNTARPENEVAWSGEVLRLGWDARSIVVLRAEPSTPYGVKAGWLVIDVVRGTQSPVLTEAELRQRPNGANIPSYRADSAWTKL